MCTYDFDELRQAEAEVDGQGLSIVDDGSN